jgi:hypothetical protein
MRRDTPEEDYEHVVTGYGGIDSWKRRVGFVDPDAAYLVLVDRTGNVVWHLAKWRNSSPEMQGTSDTVAGRSYAARCQ